MDILLSKLFDTRHEVFEKYTWKHTDQCWNYYAQPNGDRQRKKKGLGWVRGERS